MWASLATVFAAGLALAGDSLLAPKDKDKEKADKDVIQVSIVDLSFRPDPVTITVGQSVRWTNNDDRDYLIMAKDQSFKSGNLRPKETFDHTFKEAGSFDYMDVMRPRVTGTVVVEAKK